MSDSYQATYDAVRSRFHGCDAGQIMRDAMSGWDISFAVDRVMQEFMSAAFAHQEPSSIYRPSLSIDGNKWCALYGENLVNGVAGFGDSPQMAMDDFNKNFRSKLSERARS